MSGFGAQRPANISQGVPETNSTGDLFSPGYVFGVPMLPVDDDPGVAIEIPSLSTDDSTDWVTQPADQTPTPIASTSLSSADAKWAFWPGAQQSLAIALPNSDEIRSLWIPNIPVAIDVALGNAGGALMYAITLTGGEVVPIPRGTFMLTLSAANPLGVKPDIWVYATHDVFAPTKSGITGSTIPAISDTLSPYDKLVMSTPGVEFYWPCSDMQGSLSARDYGSQHKNGAPFDTNVGFGGFALLKDGTSSATFPGVNVNDAMNFPAVPGSSTNNPPWSFEFWFLFSAFGLSTGQDFGGLIGFYGTAGALRFGIKKSNLDLCSVSSFQDFGVPVPSGAPHYMAVTFDATTYKIYLDGVQVAATTVALGTTGSNALAMSGLGASASMDPIVGNMSKLAFYTGILTTQQIAARWAYHL